MNEIIATCPRCGAKQEHSELPLRIHHCTTSNCITSYVISRGQICFIKLTCQGWQEDNEYERITIKKGDADG